jgi:hypothetical protein
MLRFLMKLPNIFNHLPRDYFLEIHQRLRENYEISRANSMSPVTGCMSQVLDNSRLNGDSGKFQKLPTSLAWIVDAALDSEPVT